MLVHRMHCVSHLGNPNAIHEWFTSEVALGFRAFDDSGMPLESPLAHHEIDAVRKWCRTVFGRERNRWQFIQYEPGARLRFKNNIFQFHYHSDVVMFVTRWEGALEDDLKEVAQCS